MIERPASVVKELLENSVDAGATRVDVSVEQGGSELIRISDDGHGIRADQLVLAVASHATSKIGEADDLFHVRSLGFRGEALASIAEVSQFLLRSRTADAEAGAELEVAGGHASDVHPCGCPVGTTLEVRNLFFNTPVRRKFLRTTQTEMGHTIESFTRLALAYPDKHLTLRHNERIVYDLPAVDRWLDRITAFFGNELGDSLIWVESCHESVRLTGYVADPSVSRGNNRMQYLLLNGRPIRDRSLQHALSEAYRGLLLTGRFPVAFLRLDIPPEMVDVNVHPAKLEVRFADGRQLYSQLLATLRNKFLTTDLTARAQLHPAAEEGSRPRTRSSGRGATSRSNEELGAGRDTGGSGRCHAASPVGRVLHVGSGISTVRSGRHAVGSSARARSGRLRRRLPSRVDPSHAWPPRPVGDGLQVHNRYLVTETEEGWW